MHKKRLGVNNRYYILDKDNSDDDILQWADTCILDVLNGIALSDNSKYPIIVISKDKNSFVAAQLLKYYLSNLSSESFPYDDVITFCENIRLITSFNEIDYTLKEWVKINLQEEYFDCMKEDKYSPLFAFKAGLTVNDVPNKIIKFACYIAICHMKYGPSYATVAANKIFDLINQLGSDEVKKLKKFGSGKLPKEISEYSNSMVDCKSNDAFATIKITIKDECEQSYKIALGFIISLMKYDFPKSYSIAFKSKCKEYLPELPKHPVNQLFTNALAYSNLYSLIEEYAKTTMNEHEWYTNLNDENCAMTSSFAVFALGITSEKYHNLLCDYLEICDGEHQSIHGKFVYAYTKKYGITEKSNELYSLLSENIQEIPRKLVKLRTKLYTKKGN